MSRNRPRNSQSLHWAAVLKWMTVIGMFTVLGAAFVVLQNQIFRLAEDNRKHQVEVKAMEERNKRLVLDLQRLKSQPELQRRIAGMGLVQISQLDCYQSELSALTRLERTTSRAGSAP